MTPPSAPIKVLHPIKQVLFEKNFTFIEKIDFQKDESNKFKDTEVNLQNDVKLIFIPTQNTPVDIVFADDVTLDLVKYDEVEILRQELTGTNTDIHLYA